jgi:hypothetical protein
MVDHIALIRNAGFTNIVGILLRVIESDDALSKVLEDELKKQMPHLLAELGVNVPDTKGN